MAKDGGGRTVFHLAARSGDHAILTDVKFICDYEARLDKSQVSKTPCVRRTTKTFVERGLHVIGERSSSVR